MTNPNLVEMLAKHTPEATYLELRTADQVTDEIAEAAYEIADGRYQDTRIDWDLLLDRLDGMELKDGSVLDLGSNLLSPAITEIRKRVRKMRRAS